MMKKPQYIIILVLLLMLTGVLYLFFNPSTEPPSSTPPPPTPTIPAPQQTQFDTPLHTWETLLDAAKQNDFKTFLQCFSYSINQACQEFPTIQASALRTFMKQISQAQFAITHQEIIHGEKAFFTLESAMFPEWKEVFFMQESSKWKIISGQSIPTFSVSAHEGRQAKQYTITLTATGETRQYFKESHAAWQEYATSTCKTSQFKVLQRTIQQSDGELLITGEVICLQQTN